MTYTGLAVACLAATVASLVSCERESRPFQKLQATAADKPVLSRIIPGGGAAPQSGTSPFQENAWGISEGKRLYNAFNCVGCHSNGGGGMGPPLMDDEWIYGSRAANIFETIVEGRPNGMPAFRGKIPDVQVWQIVAYVQAMNGNAPIDALPGRSDHMSAGTPENLRPAETPVQTGSP
jgi:cytochrome c oxidase cbb3-type subunit 3